MRYIIPVILLLASACAPNLKGANESGGIITNAARKGQSFEIADKHCKKFGKSARVSGTDGLETTMTFDCI